MSFWHYVIGPGLLSSEPVRTAALVGTVVAVTSGVIGVFTVIRGQSFAGHSLADVATTGGAGAFLAGISQFWGFLLAGIAGAALMELIGVQRRRGRDVATGVVLGAALGAAALFLYLGTQSSSNNSTFSILFGSIFVISPGTVPALVVSGALALIVVAVLSRVLLLTALSPELAAARGVPVRAVGIAYLVVLAYDSYYWPPHGHGWPVSFFVVALVLIGYLLSYVRPRAKRAPRSPHEGECGPEAIVATAATGAGTEGAACSPA